MLLLELGQQAGEAIALQLVPQSAVDVTGKPTHASHLASLSDQLFFEGERDFRDIHSGIVLRVGLRSKRSG
jgi:hypothetical protein